MGDFLSNPPQIPRPAGVGLPPTGRSMPVAPTPTVQGERKTASIIPVFIAGGLTIASLAIYLLRFTLGGGLGWHLLGYLLTPILSALVLGWDAVLQRKGRKDPWFEPKPVYSKAIRFILAAGFVIAIFHILEVGTICGQDFVQSGVLCGA